MDDFLGFVEIPVKVSRASLPLLTKPALFAIQFGVSKQGVARRGNSPFRKRSMSFISDGAIFRSRCHLTVLAILKCLRTSTLLCRINQKPALNLLPAFFSLTNSTTDYPGHLTQTETLT